MIIFLIEFILWLFISSLFCLGWHTITRGYYAELPDGTFKADGQIFGFWERFWEKRIGVKYVYFSLEVVKRKYAELAYMKKELADKFELNELLFIPVGTVEIKNIIEVEGLLNCKLKSGDDGYLLYWDKKVYRFPMWIQKPISACVICYASIYGTLLWVVFCQQKGLFDWFNYKKVAYILFYFIFIVSLAWVNSFLSKKNK